MATLTFFEVVGAYYASLLDSYDADTDPDLVPLFGRIRFTPLIGEGSVVKAQTLTPPTNLLLKPIEAEIKAGIIWSNGSEGVKLVANTTVLELDGDLYYQVDFPDGLTGRGTQYNIDRFSFLAPTTATTVDLTSVTPQAGQPATGPVPTSAVLSINGRTGYVLLYVDDISDASTVGRTVMQAPDAASARAAIGVDLSDLDEYEAYANLAAFPATGSTNVVYVAQDTHIWYRWDGSSYFVASQPSLNPTSVKTSAYTAGPGELVPADATSGGFTVTLPNAPVHKAVVFVKKLDSTSNPVTIQRSGSDVFNQAGGGTSMQLVMQDQTVSLQYSKPSGIWYVTGHGTPVAATDGRYIQSGSSFSGDNIKFSRILDVNGVKIIEPIATASAVNYLRVYNNTSGLGPILQPAGASSNLPLYILLGGTGKLIVWSSANTPTVAALGSGTDADLLLESQGTGLVKANGNRVFTSAVVHAATAKTTPVDADELALVDSASSFTLARVTWANIKATLKAYYDTVVSTLTNKSIDLGSNTVTGTTAQFNTALSDNDFATLAGSETLTNKSVSLGSNTVTGTTAQFNTALSDNDFATLAGAETLTNKTLTTPKVDTVKDVNGNTVLNFSATASAVNYLQIANGASSSGPILQTVGTGTNLSMFLWLKGAGQIYVYSPNNIPTIQGWGPGTDIDLTLQGTGAGKVKGQIAPRVTSTASASSLTPSVATADMYAYTALAAGLTINAPTGTPSDGQRLRYRIKDNGSSQTLTWNAIFRALGVTLPAATTAGKVMYIDTAYNSAETLWDVTDVKIQA